ncbi:hypothetical protein ACFVZW_01055 [Streptomyces sp. NPDC059567]|uniref:hypothetical protein n=1 Tax=Streptomyces sp. NPDC059567 TaxID=3346867 RepID=UPI0036CBF3B3
MSDVVSPSAHLGRRRFLTVGLGVAAGATMWAGGASGTAAAASAPVPRDKAWRSGRTANGWSVLDDPQAFRIEGSDVVVALRGGEVATVLLHVARRFHYEIDTLTAGEIAGHTVSRTVKEAYESNYLSGTAIAIRPGGYPVGARDGFFSHELVVVRDILAECEGVVRWGGDEATPKESHFQIDVKPGDARLKALAARINGWSEAPSKGAGTVDALLPARRRAAQSMERRQRTS